MNALSVAKTRPSVGRDPAPDHYVALQREQMAAFSQQLPDFVHALKMPREQLLAVRTDRLRRLLRTAKDRSAWHARRLANINIETFTDADMRALPVMTRDDLNAHFDEIVTDPTINKAKVNEHLANLCGDAYLAGRNHAVLSGGSTGKRGTFVFDWDGWLAYGLSSARAVQVMLSLAPQSSERCAAIIGGSAVHGSVAFAQSYGQWLASRFGEFHAVSIELPIATIVERLNAIRPTCLSGYPSFLNCLCREASAGRLTITPAVILVGGETLLPEHETALRNAFGARIFNFYGCSEASCIAYSCPAGHGMHFCDDTAILEAVDQANRPTAAGATSQKVLLTNLSNLGMPLIRYELEDRVTVAVTKDPCACGSHFQKIDRVAGRTEEVFVYDTVTIDPFGFQTILGHEANVDEYRVLQTANGAHVLVAATGHLERERIAAELARILVRQGLAGAQVSLERVARIERTALGKSRRFVPLL